MHSEERAIEITTFDPLVLTPKADDVLEVFAALGFERVHAPVTATETNGDVLDVR